MATATSTALNVEAREAQGSRAARRLRRSGKVPGVIYGGGEDPVCFQVDARELRAALAHAGAVLELSVGGSQGVPVVVKEQARHPVTGETVHIDLLRVRLDQAITSTVVVELTGAEEAPGVREGGVLEQVTREISIEALPTEIPDQLELDVSEMQINDTLTVEVLSVPGEVTVLTEPETVIAMLSPPRLQVEEEPEIEEETELVAEGATEEEAESAAEGGAQEGGGGGDSGGE